MSGTSANEAQNIAVVRRGYEAFAKGDIETLKVLFSPNATWHAVETGILPGNYQGVQAILEFFGRLAHETQGSLHVEPKTMAASGDQVFVLHGYRGKRKGKTVDSKEVLVFKLDRGVMTEVSEFRFDHPTEAEFWS